MSNTNVRALKRKRTLEPATVIVTAAVGGADCTVVTTAAGDWDVVDGFWIMARCAEG